MENSKKRCHEESDAEESKRFRTDVILEILDDDDVIDSCVDSLADIVKSLEDEISIPSKSLQPDLGYLLEASDDELGLPPTVGSGTPSSDGGDVVEILDEDLEVAGFGRIWGFEDDIPDGYGSFGFGFGEPVAEDGGFGFDGGLFDYSDVGYGPSDVGYGPSEYQ